MIYKNGIRVKKIELKIDEKNQNIKCHIYLSSGRIWTGKPTKINPSIMNNRAELEKLGVITIAKTIMLLGKEMDKNDSNI